MRQLNDAPATAQPYDPMRAVKRLLLEQCKLLDISKRPYHSLTLDDVDAACDAAKAIRIRIVREYDRVRAQVQRIKQRLYYSESQRELREAGGGNVENDDDDEHFNGTQQDNSRTSPHLIQGRLRQAISAAMREDQTASLLRSEYGFLGELHIVERILVPVLVAHSLHHPTTLLPQCLKLLAAMTLPVIAGVKDMTQQEDVLASIRTRCSCDEFFVLLVHSLAPVASRRREGPLPFHDAVLLEVVLNLISNLLRGSTTEIEATVGAMCRNHGVELVLVLLTQNFEKFQLIEQQQQLGQEGDGGYDPRRLAMGTDTLAAEGEGISYSTHDDEIATDAAHGNSSNGMIVLGDSDDDDDDDDDELVIVKEEDSDDDGADLQGEGVGFGERAETQLVVLPDSQYNAMLQNEQSDDDDDEGGTGSRSLAPLTAATVIASVTPSVLSSNTAATPLVSTSRDVDATLLVTTGEDPIVPSSREVDDDGVVEFDWNAPPPGSNDDDSSSSDSDDAHGSANAAATSDGTHNEGRAHVPRRSSADSSDEESSVGSETTDEEADDEEEEEQQSGLLDDEAESGEEDDEDEQSEESEREDDAGANRRGFETRRDNFVRKSKRIAELAGDLQRETVDSIQRLNDYLLEIVALVFRCAPAADLSMLALSLQSAASGQTSVMASIQALQAKVAVEFQHQRKVDSSWRMIAKSRNGAFSTNSILVRKFGAEKQAHDQVQRDRAQMAGVNEDNMPPPRSIAVLGATSTLMGGKRVDELGFVKEQDRRKKGRFNKNMLEPMQVVSALPLPTQMHLAQQFSTFLAHGFESLSTMSWPRVQAQLKRLNVEVTETSLAGGLARGGEGPMISALDNIDVKEILNYFFLCFTLLRFTRVNLRHVLEWRREISERKKKREEECRQRRSQSHGFQFDNGGATTANLFEVPQVSLAPASQWPGGGEDNDDDEETQEDRDANAQQQELMITFEAQWKAVSHIITLEHMQAAFTLIQNFVDNKELATEHDITIPVNLAAELLLLLVHLLEGDIVQDAAVTMAAHAMGSSLLYREENISIVFYLVGNVTFRNRPTPAAAQSLMLFLHAMLSLIDRCSFNGTLALPKKKAAAAGGRRRVRRGDDDDGEDGDDLAAAGGGILAGGDEEEDDDEDDDPEAVTQEASDLRALQQFIVADGDEDAPEELKRVPELVISAHDDEELDGDALVQRMREEEFLAKERLLLGVVANDVDDDMAAAPSGKGDDEENDDVTTPPLRRQPDHDTSALSAEPTTSLLGAQEDDDDEVSLHDTVRPTTAMAEGEGMVLLSGEGSSEHLVSDVIHSSRSSSIGDDDEREDQHLTNESLRLRARSHESEESGSVVLSSRTGNTSMTSEREVRVQDYYLKLSTPKYIPIVYFTLCNWRINDGDTNHAICTVLENLLSRSIGISAIFCFPFLLVFHDILAPSSGAEETHRPLYDVADKIVFQFFNPAFAKSARPLFDVDGRPVADGEVVDDGADQERGAMSNFGTEVAFRCTRAFFLLNPSHYSVLEDAGLQRVLAFNDSVVQANIFDGGAPDRGDKRVSRRQRGVGGPGAEKRASFAAAVHSDDDDDLGLRSGGSSDDDEEAALFKFTARSDGATVEGDNGAGKKKTRGRAVKSSTGEQPLKSTGRGRPRKHQVEEDASGSSYVMGNADVTALAREVDRREKKLVAELKRKQAKQPNQKPIRRRNRKGATSSDESSAASNSSDEQDIASAAASKKATALPTQKKGDQHSDSAKHSSRREKKEKRDKKDKKDRKHRRHDDLEGEDSDRKARKRHRKEEKRSRRSTQMQTTTADGGDGEGGASPAPGSLIHGDDGAVFMVHEDGYAYQVTLDATTGAYTFVEGVPAAEGDTQQQALNLEQEYRAEENDRIADLLYGQHIAQPVAIPTPPSDEGHFGGELQPIV